MIIYFSLLLKSY